MKIVIYLIEDDPVEATEIIENLNNRTHDDSYTDGYEYEFKWLEGTSRGCYGNQEWSFYEPEVIDQIRKTLYGEKAQGNKMGLLLDVLLTKEDMKNSLSAYYPIASIARDIYFEFYKEMPIHIITSMLMFGTQSEIIMGTDLSDSYIAKEVLNYPFDDDVKDMFKKYRT